MCAGINKLLVINKKAWGANYPTVLSVFLFQTTPSSPSVCLEFDQYPWNKAYPFSNGVFMLSVLLFSLIRRHRFQVHATIFGDSDSTPEQCWWGHITHLVFLHFCFPISSALSPGLYCHLPFPLLHSFYLSLTRSLSLSLSVPLFPLWFIGNESGMREYAGGEMGTFREMAVSGQTSSHQDGKWLEEKSVCVSMCKCFSIIRPSGDQLMAAQVESSSVNHNPLIVFKWKLQLRFAHIQYENTYRVHAKESFLLLWWNI